jgi:hypothetical protein
MGSEGGEQPGNGGPGSRGQASDPIGDFQRWLMRAGARSLGRDVADRVRITVSGGRRTSSEVWDIATTEPPPDEAPECAWCPICRAARRYRESGSGGAGGSAAPGLGSQLAGVSETLTGLAQDAFGIFDAALRSGQQRSGNRAGPVPGGPASGSPERADAPPAPSRTGWPAGKNGSDNGPVVGPVLGRPAVHPQDDDGEAANEGGHGDEGGESGNGRADDRGDD